METQKYKGNMEVASAFRSFTKSGKPESKYPWDHMGNTGTDMGRK